MRWFIARTIHNYGKTSSTDFYPQLVRVNFESGYDFTGTISTFTICGKLWGYVDIGQTNITSPLRDDISQIAIF